MTYSEVTSAGRAEEILDVCETACCVVVGGPGGMTMAVLLARRGVPDSPRRVD